VAAYLMPYAALTAEGWIAAADRQVIQRDRHLGPTARHLTDDVVILRLASADAGDIDARPATARRKEVSTALGWG